MDAETLPAEYRISVPGQELLVRMTSNCEAIGLNAIIQTVENDTVSSATFGNSLHRHCYRGELQSSNGSSVVLTSLLEGPTGIAVMDRDILFFRPSASLPLSTKSSSSPQTVNRRSSNNLEQSEKSVFPQGGPNSVNGANRQNISLIEILLVLDKVTVDRHDGDVENFVNTVMSIVQELFREQTIGIDIRLAVVNLILLRQNLKELPITSVARNTLQAFCNWKKNLSSAVRHDLAILLTGRDLCLGDSCGVSGHSKFNTMCHSRKSCIVVEDRGLPTAFSIASEIGRVLGLNHDGKSNKCSAQRGNIMSPLVGATMNLFRWSECSKRELADSVRKAKCLNKTRSRPATISDGRLPGQIYSTSQQCQMLRLDGAVRACPYHWAKKELCYRLWCRSLNDSDLHCETNGTPAADGTPCGPGTICMKGRCVGEVPCRRPAKGQPVRTANTSFNDSYTRWDMRGDGPFQISLRGSNMCITAGMQQDNQTVALQLDKCAGLTDRMFQYTRSTSVITHTATGLCLTVHASRAVLAHCTFAEKQQWETQSSTGFIVSPLVDRKLSVCG
jgi:hypothetical protein